MWQFLIHQRNKLFVDHHTAIQSTLFNSKPVGETKLFELLH